MEKPPGKGECYQTFADVVSVLRDIPDVICEAMVDIYFADDRQVRNEQHEIVYRNNRDSYLSAQKLASQLIL